MRTLIAMSKESATGSLLNLPYSLKREAFHTTLTSSSKSSSLAQYGFQNINLATKPEGSFRLTEDSALYLPYLGMYIVNASDPVHENDAKSILSDEYEIFDNPGLTLNTPVSVALEGIRRKKFFWPELSGIKQAHKSELKGNKVLVAVLDTGCDADHHQFRHKTVDFTYVSPLQLRPGDRLRSVRGFDPNGHGTHVSSIICGADYGVAPNVDLAVFSVIESESTYSSLARILIALEQVVKKALEARDEYTAVIINMSLGFFENNLDEPTNAALSATLKRAMNRILYEFDILPIVAIGNEGQGTYRFPGAFRDVVGVGAVDFKLNPADFSGSGVINSDHPPYNKPDIVGYGVNIYSAYDRTVENRSRYAQLNGTSMAAPYVTGIASLLAESEGLRGVQLKNKLLDTALSLDLGIRVGRGLAVYG